MSYVAVHLPGGNRLDDVRLDLPASYAEQDRWLGGLARASVRRGRLRSAARRRVHRLEPYRVREALVNSGLRRAWFEEFRDYWENVLGGRPLTLMDFHHLRFAYRLRAHARDRAPATWETAARHVENWQQPQNLFQTLDFVYRTALHPAWEGRLLFDVLRPGSRVLEYGCSVAPMYRTWRTFLADRPAEWVLADIPGFAFHFARHAFARDAEASFVTIDDLDDPLRDVEGSFDLVIVQAVFEHLDRPRRVAEYLLDRVRPGGLFWFEYSTTEERGLDTPAGMAERRETLEHIAGRIDVVRGELRIDDMPLAQCLGRRRA